MTALFLSVLVSSLLGSLHCAGMCGPLVAVYAGDDPSRGWRRLLAHALYSSGRLAAYATVGALAGALGEAAGTTVTGMPVLQPNSARTMVRRLVALTGTRARLFGERGALLADSRVLISAGRAVEATPLGGETPSEKGSK